MVDLEGFLTIMGIYFALIVAIFIKDKVGTVIIDILYAILSFIPLGGFLHIFRCLCTIQ